MEGVPASEVKDELISIANRRGELEAQLKAERESGCDVECCPTNEKVA
jgi:hypothetical protein